jgi:hypothetical protein
MMRKAIPHAEGRGAPLAVPRRESDWEDADHTIDQGNGGCDRQEPPGYFSARVAMKVAMYLSNT